MEPQHQKLAAGRWKTLSLIEQMANLGSEVERTILWKEKGNDLYRQKSFERALELLDLTIADPKNKKRLRELTRLREVLVDYFLEKTSFPLPIDSGGTISLPSTTPPGLIWKRRNSFGQRLVLMNFLLGLLGQESVSLRLIRCNAS